MVDWDSIDVEAIVERAGQRTDDALASKISSLTTLTDEEVKELFPEPADVKKLAELMKIVKSAEGRNTKINQIISNSEKFAGITLTLLSKFA